MKLNRDVFVVLFAVLGCLSLSVQIYSQELVDVDGYLVDSYDNPLQNGTITVFYDPPLPTTSFEHLIITRTPMADGRFGVAVDWLPERKIMVLLEDRPDGFYPIHDSKVLADKRIFRGVIISKFIRRIDVGRIKDYIKYGQVVVDVTKCSASFLEKVLKFEMYLKVSGPDGFVAAAKSTFRSAYIKQKGQLVFNLPEGVWRLEFLEDTAKDAFLPALNVVITPPEKVLVTDWKGCQ
jgi:hypothetical protein